MNAKLTKLPGLDGIRTIATLCILIGHIPQRDFCGWSVPIIPVPDLCAYTFFVLTGFLSGYKANSVHNYSTYIRHKAKRLLIPYFFCILVVVLFYAFSNNFDTVINRRLLYYIALIPEVPFSLHNGIVPLIHLWFIGVLVLFHLLFPLICRKSIIARSLTFIFVWLSFKYGLYLLVGSDCFMYRFVSCTAMDCLFWGVIVGQLYQSKSHLVQFFCDNSVIQLFTWGLFLTFYFYRLYIPAPIRIQFFALLSSLMILSQLGKTAIINLDKRFLSFLGSISYEIYLFHIPIIIALSIVFVRLSILDNPILIYIVCIVLTITVAFFANRLFRLVNGNSTRIQPYKISNIL